MHRQSLKQATAPTHHPTSTLRSLLTLRWISLGSQLVVLAGLVMWLQVNLPIGLISPALLLLLVANIVGYRQLQSSTQISGKQLMTHLTIDFFALGWVLYCTGGASNPFASLLLLPLTMSAITLPGYCLWVTTPLAVATYTALVFYNIPLPPPQGSLQLLDQVLAETCSIGGNHGNDDLPGSGFALHVAGMWVNFAISAGIVYFFLARQAMRLRQHELTLQAMRERSLREEKVLAIALMAAGAAHKLGTPLATLAVLLGEIEPGTPADEEDVALMHDQIGRCKSILNDMVASATPQNRSPLAVMDWINGWLDEWHLLRPTALRPAITLTTEGKHANTEICPDRTLDQAIQGLLDNAADANAGPNLPAERLAIEITLDLESLQIDILDRGLGISEQMAELLGSEFIHSEKTNLASTGSTSPRAQVGGLGIGFFLTNATIERFNGKVELFRREPQGTCTRIKLPLQTLRSGLNHSHGKN